MPSTPTTTPVTCQTLEFRAGGRAVPLIAGPGALDQLAPTLQQVSFAGRLFLVADAHAEQLHRTLIQQAFPFHPLLAISGEESAKSIQQVQRVWDWLVEQRAQRRDALVAIGGGVVCDIVGFAASSYMRGIGLVNVPTTLLAQVDASVGGKTGVNHASAKNLIGAFYQPLAVVADTRFLRTLTQRDVANGLAEVAKISMTLDADLFARLESEAPGYTPESADALTPVIARAIQLKAEIVERDEREAGDRMLLNYGHTIGHAIEAASDYTTFLHGEAIAIGMAAAAHIAQGMGLLSTDAAARQAALLQLLHLPQSLAGLPPEAILSRLSLDKKRAGARQCWILADGVGSAHIRDDVPDDLVYSAVASILR